MQAPDSLQQLTAHDPAMGADHDLEHAHPGPTEYVKIALILAVVTAVEVGLYYLELAKGAMILLLLVLSAVKFALVILFFMHLRFDNKLFSWFFVSGLIGAFLAFFAVLNMFRVFY